MASHYYIYIYIYILNVEILETRVFKKKRLAESINPQTRI